MLYMFFIIMEILITQELWVAQTETNLRFCCVFGFVLLAEEKRECLDTMDCEIWSYDPAITLISKLISTKHNVFITVSFSVCLHFCCDASNQASHAIKWNWVFSLKFCMIKRKLSAKLYNVYWAAVHFRIQIKTISIVINLSVLWYIFSSIKFIVQHRVSNTFGQHFRIISIY